MACAATLARPGTDALAVSLCRSFVASPAHVGLSIGIVENGERRSVNFGSIDRAHPDVPTGRTVHEPASLTKSCTGMLLARAVIDGKMSLDDDDDDLRRYLPAGYANLSFAGYPIRIVDLVTFRHTGERGDDIGVFGILNRRRHGSRIVRHAGGSFGPASFVLLVPDAKAGVVLLANDAGAASEQELSAMADRLAAAPADGK